MKLIPVKYHNKEYPKEIADQLIEVAGNLDSKEINIITPYSLHTEYSYMKRQLNSELLNDLMELKNSHKNGIPQLWKSIQWSEEFAIFIRRLIGNSIPPEVIEIHPPFKDYCENIETFWKRYIVFYKSIITYFPNVKILIENRCGTMYTNSAFLFSTCEDMLDLGSFLLNGHNELGMIVDYPQLFSAEKIKMDNVKLDKILNFNAKLESIKESVGAIHLWGKRKSKKSGRWSPHSGDLNTFFSYDNKKKSIFLNSMKNTFNDNKPRYFIPEVNTTESDLQSIVKDLISFGFEFIQKEFSEHLISIDWEEGPPQFVLCDNSNNIIKLNAIGDFSIRVGNRKYCIGNKDIIHHEFLGCHTVLEETLNSKKCTICNQNDLYKYCTRCIGQNCYVQRKDVLERCNQEHFVYLTFFPNEIVKIGVAHNRRKYVRLFEQGSIYSLIIASCKTGKIARNLEHAIKELGVKDKVSSKTKIENISNFDLKIASEQLEKTYSLIRQQINIQNYDGVYFFDTPETVFREDVASMLCKLSYKDSLQISIWDYLDNSSKNDVEILDDINGFNGCIELFIGNIAVLSQMNKYYFFDFGKIIGKELRITKH